MVYTYVSLCYFFGTYPINMAPTGIFPDALEYLDHIIAENVFSLYLDQDCSTYLSIRVGLYTLYISIVCIFIGVFKVTHIT